MMFDPSLLDLLVCPENQAPLAVADDALLAQVNQAIGQGRLKTRAGRELVEPLAGGLVRADRAWLYPIVDGIPILLVDEAIALDPISPEEKRAGSF